MENIRQKLASFNDSTSSARRSMDEFYESLLKAYKKLCDESREKAGNKYFQTLYLEEVTYEYVDKDFNRKEFKKRNDWIDGYRYSISMLDEYAFPVAKTSEMKMRAKTVEPRLSFNEFMGFDEENK